MEFKGTKGKWYRNAESRIVSSVYSENKESLIHISGKCTEEKQANAQLISKAPEMLQMLQRIENILTYDNIEPNSPIQEEIYNLIKQATEL